MDNEGCFWIIGVIIAAAIIFAVIVPFVSAYWPWIVTIAVALGVGWAGIAHHVKKQAAETEAHRQRELAVSAQNTLADFSKYLTPCLIIDSNIWMNEDYDEFFQLLGAACNTHMYKLSLFGPQFDEISNIKKNTQYGEDRNKRARLAINRVEEFQKKNWLNVKPITIDAKRGAYADPLIVKVITTQARKGTECTFISDDKELRIRVRQHLSDYAEADWRIIEISSILLECRAYSEAVELNLIPESCMKNKKN